MDSFSHLLTFLLTFLLAVPEFYEKRIWEVGSSPSKSQIATFIGQSLKLPATIIKVRNKLKNNQNAVCTRLWGRG